MLSRSDLSFNGAVNPKNGEISGRDRLEVVFDYIVLSKKVVKLILEKYWLRNRCKAVIIKVGK